MAGNAFLFGTRSNMDNNKPTVDIMPWTKALRVSIDRCIKDAQVLADELNRGDGAREVALTITKLEEAKMWLGKSLGARGHYLPAEYRDEA